MLSARNASRSRDGGDQSGPETLAAATPVAGLPANVVQLDVGPSHACAVTRGGAVLCWGHNRWGQLGDGTRERRDLPVQVAGIADALEVRATEASTCALRADGSVWCWGSDARGQLGLGTEVVYPSALRVALPP